MKEINEIRNLKWYQLLYFGTIKIQNKIRLYRKLLNSDKYFSEREYEYFGNRIYKLRLLRKQIGEELALRIFNKKK